MLQPAAERSSGYPAGATPGISEFRCEFRTTNQPISNWRICPDTALGTPMCTSSKCAYEHTSVSKLRPKFAKTMLQRARRGDDRLRQEVTHSSAYEFSRRGPPGIVYRRPFQMSVTSCGRSLLPLSLPFMAVKSTCIQDALQAQNQRPLSSGEASSKLLKPVPHTFASHIRVSLFGGAHRHGVPCCICGSGACVKLFERDEDC